MFEEKKAKVLIHFHSTELHKLDEIYEILENTWSCQNIQL